MFLHVVAHAVCTDFSDHSRVGISVSADIANISKTDISVSVLIPANTYGPTVPLCITLCVNTY